MSGRYQNKGRKNRKRRFREEAEKNRPMFAGDMFKGFGSAVGSVVGAIGGVKAMGPVGAGAGAITGSVLGETGKHYLTSWMNSSSGPSVGSFNSVAELKSSVYGLIDSVRADCDTRIKAARGNAETALDLIERATDGSTNSLVSDAITGLHETLMRMEEVLSASDRGKSNAETWVEGL